MRLGHGDGRESGNDEDGDLHVGGIEELLFCFEEVVVVSGRCK
jgi:hypothetical protein